MLLHCRILCFVAPEYLVILQTEKVDGIDPIPQNIEVPVVPSTLGIDNPAPFPVTLPIVTVPAVSLP